MALTNVCNTITCSTRKLLIGNRTTNFLACALYHDKPRDKAKIAREQAALEQEKAAASAKYEPFKEITPLDDVLKTIRAQAKAVPASAIDSPQTATSEDGELQINTCHISVDSVLDDGVTPYRKEQKKCIICKHNIQLDYKNVRLLSQFVSPFTGRIYGGSVTGLCVPMQARISKLIRRARRMGFMPVVQKSEEFLNDPELFNPFTRRA